MVTIRSDAVWLPTTIEQERATSPLMCTEQAPHCATPHPYFVPVNASCSRMTHRSGVSASTCTSRIFPFTLSFAMDGPLAPQNSAGSSDLLAWYNAAESIVKREVRE